VTCITEGSDSFAPIGSALGGGATFLEYPGADAEVTASVPATTAGGGTPVVAGPGDHVNAWIARAANFTGGPLTLRIFVRCFGNGP
jgi:hypothetical protein